MKIHKTLILALLSISALPMASCNKNNQQKNTIMSNSNSVTMPDFDSIVASYTTMPNYYIAYGNTDCLFELRVNDMVVDRLTRPGRIGGTAATINPYITQSGKQKVSLKLYPNPGQTMIKSSGNQEYPYFVPFRLKIDYMDFKLPDDDQEIIDVYVMPDIVTPKEGIPYYELEAEFEAKVPYTITNHDDYIDLREIPDIEKRVVDEFNRVRQLMIDHKFDELRSYFAQRDIDAAISMYQTNEVVNESWVNYEKRILKATAEDWQPIEDYRLEFEADGRSVTLRSEKKKGFVSALLWIKQKEGESRWNASSIELHLGIKKGTDKFVANLG